MDAKEKLLVNGLSRRIIGRTYHERDVLALLILLREHAPTGSPLRELADFIAHREKDRGLLQKYVRHVVAYGEALADGSVAQLKIDPVYTASAFRDTLNTVLDSFLIAPLSPESADDVLACTMSLLQDIRVIHEKREIGQLRLVRFDKDLWLCASVTMQPKEVKVVFPALIVPNRYCALGNAQNLEFGGLVEARCTKGRLRLFIDGRQAA